MARRRRFEADIPSSALQFDVAFAPDQADGLTVSPEAAVEPVEDEIAAVAQEDAPEPSPGPPAAPEHKDIGQWEAIYWKGRPIWRHRRTKTTLHKRDAVWKLRNLK